MNRKELLNLFSQIDFIDSVFGNSRDLEFHEAEMIIKKMWEARHRKKEDYKEYRFYTHFRFVVPGNVPWVLIENILFDNSSHFIIINTNTGQRIRYTKKPPIFIS